MKLTESKPNIQHSRSSDVKVGWDGPLETAPGSEVGFQYNVQNTCWIQTPALYLLNHILITIQICLFIGIRE